MAKLMVLSCLLALSQAAPSQYGAGPIQQGYAGQGLAQGYAGQGLGQGYADLGAVQGYGAVAPLTTVQETLHAGPVHTETEVHHGVVGSRTVQVGSRQVVDGHQYAIAGKSVEQAPAYSYVAGEPRSYQNTVAIAPPAIPAALPPVIPPPPRNYGPAPINTVTQELVAAPVRTHTQITPVVRRIEPELYVNRVPVDVPVPHPVPVEREVIHQTHVPKPYTVEVPQPYPVPEPYKVHPIQQVVSTPVIDQVSHTVHQPIATAVQQYVEAAPVVEHAAQGYAAAPVVAQGYAAQGYAGQGYAGQGYAGQGYAGQGYAGQGFAGQGYAGQGFAGQGFAGQGYAGQGFAGQGFSGQGYAGQGFAGQGFGAQGYAGATSH